LAARGEDEVGIGDCRAGGCFDGFTGEVDGGDFVVDDVDAGFGEPFAGAPEDLGWVGD
jgi:hypothetical protein